jgi:hypothetical protein
MNKLKVNESLLVGVDFTNDEDVGVLLVGRRENGTVKIINAFQGQEAIDIYKKLIDVEKKEDQK